jgi:hypothetical protein
MTKVIDATIARGYGVASKNIKFQMPHLVWHFPEIRDIYTASINVELDTPLPLSTFDFTSLPIAWWDVADTHPGRWAVERFSFVRITFEYPLDTSPKNAWLYIAHNSAYFKDPKRFEIITEKIDGLVPGTRCRVHAP